MIRFIDLREYDIGRFAFFDTVTDTFVNYGQETFDTWDEFVEMCWAEDVAVQRYRKLCPSWVFEPAPD